MRARLHSPRSRAIRAVSGRTLRFHFRAACPSPARTLAPRAVGAQGAGPGTLGVDITHVGTTRVVDMEALPLPLRRLASPHHSPCAS